MRAPALGVLFILAAGCHRGKETTSSATAPAPSLLVGEVTLKVINHGRLDVVVYLVHNGARDRIGESTASGTQTFKFNLRKLGAGRDYYLFGDPIGSTKISAQTEVLVAESGQLVIWTLEDDLKRSSVEVR